MAEILGIATGVVEIVTKLSSFPEKEIDLIWGVKGEVKKLQRTFTMIQAVLMDAERRQADEVLVRVWLRELKEVAYDADDVLDVFNYEALRHKHSSSLKSKVLNFFWHSNPLLFRLTMAHKIKDINETLHEIETRMKSFNFNRGVVAEHPNSKIDRMTHSFVNELDVVGRESDKSNIVDMLVKTDSQEILSVIPMVGIGGLGKTTLAKLVYKDESVVKHFEHKMWICVSDTFDATRLVKEMLESFSATGEGKSLDVMGRELKEKMSGKKFLLVLDDVWNENYTTWHDFKPLLEIGAQGSKIIVTTRSENVASIMKTPSIDSYHLKGLSDDKCLSIFEKIAFRSGGAEKTQNLIKIGKELVKKCRGVPLAVNSLAGLMHSRKDEREWRSIQDSEIWNLSEDKNGILPSLKLSYNYFPSPLKQCFAYCSVFPKDFVIKKQRLIQLWMAEGYLQPSKQSTLMEEDIGNKYFDYLLGNSFFQDLERDDFGNIETCKMHDLVHDLASSIAGSEVLIAAVCENNEVEIPEKTRHLSLVFGERTDKIPKELLYNLKKVHTLLLLRFGWSSGLSAHIPKTILNCKMLRVLDFSGNRITELPSSIAKLIHLRYLDLSGNPIKMLPESITVLYNLRTLILKDCIYLKGLPRHMRRMSNLRHLEIDDSWFRHWSGMPQGIGQLSKLQTLPLFVVGNGNTDSCISELGCLGQLRGSLRLRHLENVKNGINAKEANLNAKPNLRDLYLHWENGDSDIKVKDDDVIEGLQPHPNIKELCIVGFAGSTFPTWMKEGWHCQEQQQQQQLERLKICNCPNTASLKDHLQGLTSLLDLEIYNCRKLASFGGKGLTALKKLSISNCPELPCLSDEEGIQHLKSLQELSIHDCPNLISLSEGMQHLKALRTLQIKYCSKLTALPEGFGSLTSLQSLYIERCQILESLPTRIEGLISLQNLSFYDCPTLMALSDGLGNLSALQRLTINHCPNLESLPEGLRNLTSLQRLEIEECPELKIRCKRGEGEDWPKIQHIPNVHIRGW